MNLSELLAAVGPAPLRTHLLLDGGRATVGDVVITDAACPMAPGQLVLAVGVDACTSAARDVLDQASRAGVAAVVFRSPGAREVTGLGGTSVLFAEDHIGWAQLLVLLRTLTSAAQDQLAETPERTPPSSMHGLADAIAVMVGGTVVLYDRAHRVIAYSVRGHEIDDVRRDAILGKRTPEQWIKRFTVDRSAYQTYQNPDDVIRVDKYPNLRTRLRIAIHAGGEILGEISVAEGRHPLGGEAEEALKRAAALAVPFMLRHRTAEDTDRNTRWRMLRGLLAGDAGVESQATQAGLAPEKGLAVVGFAVHADERADATVREVFAERLVHLLSLQMASLDPAAGVVHTDGTYYAVVPTRTEAIHERLSGRLAPALAQLVRLDIDARAAVGRRVASLARLPDSRRDVDDQLVVLERRGAPGQVGTRGSLWAELVVLPAERAVEALDAELGGHLHRLLVHDERNGTEFVKTLRVYLDQFGSISAAADELVLHPNTLRHRLARLTELSGIDLGQPAQRLVLSLQLRVLAHGRG